MDIVRLWTDPAARAAADSGELGPAGHPSGLVDLSDPVIDPVTGAGPALAGFPLPGCPLRASRLAAEA